MFAKSSHLNRNCDRQITKYFHTQISHQVQDGHIDQQKAVWFQSDFCVSSASWIPTFDNGSFCTQNCTNITAPLRLKKKNGDINLNEEKEMEEEKTVSWFDLQVLC